MFFALFPSRATRSSRSPRFRRTKWWHRHVVFKKQSRITCRQVTNRPFYICVLSYLAFECKRGWRWPCFDTDLSAFLFKCQLVSIRTTWLTEQKQWGLYQNKVTSSHHQRPGHWADNCKMVYWVAAFIFERRNNLHNNMREGVIFFALRVRLAFASVRLKCAKHYACFAG